MAYFNLGSYREAIPFYSDLINRRSFNDGKSEYLRGMCYLKLGQKEKALPDLVAARNLGFDVAPSLIESCR
jgi:tetratricopeptide (TPR) repeat protein